MMKMFNQRFKILRPEATVNEFGEQVQSLNMIGTRWAEVKAVKGDFYPAGTSQKWLNVLQIKSKHYPNKDILLTDLIEYDGNKYRILQKTLDDNTFRYMITLKCTAVE